ncbi:DUF4229 domain-containing protein [Frankia sp. AgB1.9]|uniref:DUF4229 domain-containing protein n=1 Tax=unclassified Frankia TaxID=2632575 RepID=UPI0019342A0C|nr:MULTISPECIES: DUF4229 domain-containing protein [unclassified Frankia]MBL7488443.1 DUF4229 domain-containing protein [Frankia sp. AgW1.1]MBL7550145.1 DUF4229 domain-containing protein [Frankia sp. AgB1.9]MBL7625004.1 DUF4229 domain-containing protein [Frankia sp. AgB1.8]
MREIGMARGRGDRADKAATPTVAKGTPATKVTPAKVTPTKVTPAKVKVKQTKVAPPPGKTGSGGLFGKRPKRELEEFDLRAALPFFLARIGIFLVIAVVLWLAAGLPLVLAVLLGLIGGALAGYPLARMQKQAARVEGSAPAPPVKPVKPPKARK